MTGPELAAELRALASTVELSAGSVSGLTLRAGAEVTVAVASAGAKRQRRWRASKPTVSEPVSQGVSAASHGPSPPRLPKRLEPVSPSVSEASRRSLPSSPPTPPSDSYPSDTPKASVVVSEVPDTSRARNSKTTPTTLEQALTEPLGVRAMYVKRDPMLGSLLRVSEWPEVVEVATAWHAAGRRPGEARVTGGVATALVSLFADGYMLRDVLRVAKHLPTTERFRDKVLPSCLTAEVMAIALGELAQGEQSRDAVRERLGKTRSPEPAGGQVGALVGRLAAGGGQ